MGLNKDNRMTVSLSDIGDADLIEVLGKVDYDFSRFVRELLRDGLKYRGLGDTVGRSVNPKSTTPIPTKPKKGKNSTKPTPSRNGTRGGNGATVVDKKKHVEDKLDSKL